ncbi:MAG: hypothetical protein LRY71_12500 [Bacillaceae bacterium]|nr:hypothetical protein [Bacillaceae bacterium]
MWEEIFSSDDFTYEKNDHCLIGLGNSLELLKKMKDKTVNLIFADPPYNIGKDFGERKDKWDTKEEYIDWCKDWIDECFRVLKDDGTFYFMGATQFLPYLDVYVQENYHVLSRIIWSYDSSGVQSKKNVW